MKQITEAQRLRDLAKSKKSKEHQEDYIARQLKDCSEGLERLQSILNNYDDYVNQGGISTKEDLEEYIRIHKEKLKYWAIGEEIQTPPGIYKRILL